MTAISEAFEVSTQSFLRDPYATMRAMRAAGPITDVAMPVIGNIKVTTTFEAGDFVLRHADLFTVDPTRAEGSNVAEMLAQMPPELRLISQNMLTTDDPDHRRLRKMVDGSFRRAQIEALRPRIAAIAAQRLDELFASDDRDLVAHVAKDFPLSVICELLGLPDGDRPQFKQWMATSMSVGESGGFANAIPGISKISEYLRLQFDVKRKYPGDDLITGLVSAQEGNDPLSDDELVAMCFLLFVAGHETTTNLISGGILALIQNPEQARRLRDDPALDASATEEMLRYVSPVQATKPRTPLDEIEIAGVPIKKGDPIMVHLASGNTDPKHFDHADEFDIGRTDNRHLAFGSGIHLCLGNWLARTEMQVLTRELLQRSPDLALAIPESDLQWNIKPGHRSLKSLPLKL